jgi:hypothetical protein
VLLAELDGKSQAGGFVTPLDRCRPASQVLPLGGARVV